MNSLFEDVKRDIVFLNSLNMNQDSINIWYQKYTPYYFILLRDYVKPNVKDMLNIAGDEKLKNTLDDILNNYEFSLNLFDTLNYSITKKTFDALEIRINEESLVLNKQIYVTLLNAFKSYENIKNIVLMENERYKNQIEFFMDTNKNQSRN